MSNSEIKELSDGSSLQILQFSSTYLLDHRWADIDSTESEESCLKRANKAFSLYCSGGEREDIEQVLYEDSCIIL